ncbi:glycosyl transferase [Streptomyces sp. MUSC 14]|uniref:glycosyltransferase n=1 Tax=Streptomyces sp. MUSC 14 TaxID=1354889 RepID=UPI0008F55C59|nr:glycosyltransferase [Streptomyces sp. MUSC 14]OIK00493.1 glycosyl transferase [Streptomyces sp. MUSC 14]
MRVLFTTLGSPSHGRAQLPLARALAAAGHDVLVATAPSLVPLFAQDDVRVSACVGEFSVRSFITADVLAQASRSSPEGEARHGLLERAMLLAMSGPMAEVLLERILPVAREFRPDLILRDGMDLSSCLTAEHLGVPQLPTPSGAGNTVDPAQVLPRLNAVRREQGLPDREDPLSIVPHGRIDYVPAAFSFARHLPPSWAYRQTVAVEHRSVLPRWIAELPTDRPLVFAALGTALPMIREQTAAAPAQEQLPVPLPDPVVTLRSMIEAAGRLEECTVVVATSGLPADTEGLPAHVRVTDRVPQPLLLESVDAFLTHGGFNSVRESLRTATPMAVLPQFGDQFSNAHRVQELGLGRPIDDSTPDGIAAAVREVLTDPRIRARTREARLAMLALPEIESAVEDLKKLA